MSKLFSKSKKNDPQNSEIFFVRDGLLSRFSGHYLGGNRNRVTSSRSWHLLASCTKGVDNPDTNFQRSQRSHVEFLDKKQSTQILLGWFQPTHPQKILYSQNGFIFPNFRCEDKKIFESTSQFPSWERSHITLSERHF